MALAVFRSIEKELILLNLIHTFYSMHCTKFFMVFLKLIFSLIYVNGFINKLNKKPFKEGKTLEITEKVTFIVFMCMISEINCNLFYSLNSLMVYA